MRSGTEMSQFLRIFLPTFLSLLITLKLSLTQQVNILRCLIIREILVMTQYTALLSLSRPQIYIWSKLEVSIPCGYLET